MARPPPARDRFADRWSRTTVEPSGAAIAAISRLVAGDDRMRPDRREAAAA